MKGTGTCYYNKNLGDIISWSFPSFDCVTFHWPPAHLNASILRSSSFNDLTLLLLGTQLDNY